MTEPAQRNLPDTVWKERIQRWQTSRNIIWATVAVAFLSGYFHRTVIGVVADSLMGDFAIERAADLGILASIYFWTYAALQLPAGILADTWGPRRVISLALLIASLGAFLFAVAGTLTTLYAARFLTTLGIGVIFVSLIKIQSSWFRAREFATMSGLIVLVGNSGSLLSSTPMAFIVEGWGWRAAFHLIGGYSLLMAAVCWKVVRDRPEDLGLPSLIEIEAREEHARAKVDNPNLCVADCVKGVLKNPRTWPPVIAATSLFGVYMSIVGVWWVPYLMQIHQLPRVEASQHVFLMVLGNMLGAPLIGLISDRLYCRRWPYLACTTFLTATLLTLTLWDGAKPPLFALFPLSFAMGLGISGISLTIACVKDVNSPHVTGIAAGISNSGPFIGAAIMQPSFGWVLDRYWLGAIENGIKIYPRIAYENAFWLCIIILTIGLVAAFFIQERRNE